MSGPGLPVNVDSTYADSGGDASVKLHQQHHDAIHAIVNNFDATEAAAGDIQVLGHFGVGVNPTDRQPFTSVQSMDGNPTGTIDKVAHELNSSITGQLTSGVGSNPTFFWGLNVFTTTGSSANDGNGGNIQNLIETSIAASSGTIVSAFGCFAEAAFFGAAAGCTVTNMTSLRVGSPKRKDGATAGTATNAYGLYVEDTQASAVGATSAFAIYTDGGVVRVGNGGRFDHSGDIANSGSGDTFVYAGFSTSDGARLAVRKTGNGGHIEARMGTSSAFFQVHDGSSTTWSVSRTGIPKWDASGNQQTTVGAAGGASALPATPTKYLKITDSAGTTLVVPAYAAA